MAGRSAAVRDPIAQGAETSSQALLIRPMTLDDLDDVLAIERASFSNPWTEEMFQAELIENPCARFFVAAVAGALVGYVGGWLVLDELQVVSLAVRPDARRRGVATRLLARLFECGGDRLRRASLEVRRSNAAAIALYERFGFRPVGVRQEYYADPKEDAVVMERVM